MSFSLLGQDQTVVYSRNKVLQTTLWSKHNYQLHKALLRNHKGTCLKIVYFKVPIAFSSPRAQPKVVIFWVSNESPYFSHLPKKVKLQIHYTLEVIAENVSISSVPTMVFSCIFITASSTVSHTYFCPR